MMPIDILAETAKFQELYAAYPGAFHGAGIALTVVFLYFAVIEIADAWTIAQGASIHRPEYEKLSEASEFFAGGRYIFNANNCIF